MKLKQFIWNLISVLLLFLAGSTIGDDPEHSEHELVAQCIDESHEYGDGSILVRSQNQGQCSGYSTPCQAVTDGALNLVCPACQNQTGITWTHTNRSIKLEGHNTFNITLQRNSGTIADGCYACTCLEQTKCQFLTEVKPSVAPYLMVKNCTAIDGDIHLCEDCNNCPPTINLNVSSPGTIEVNCSSGGWPDPKVSLSIMHNDGSSLSAVNEADYGMCFNSSNSTLHLNVTYDIGHAPQGVVATCHVKNIAGIVNATRELKFDSWSSYFLRSLVDTSSQPQVIPLHNGVGSSFCGAYPEDDDQFTYRLCLRNTTSPSSHNECETFFTCCECGSCDDPAILALTNITSQTTYDRHDRQICNFSVTNEVTISCHGWRNGVLNAAFQDLSIHVAQTATKSINLSPNNTTWIIVSSVLGVIVLVLVVAMAVTLTRTVFKRQLGKNKAQTEGSGRGRGEVGDVRESGAGHHGKHEERVPSHPDWDIVDTRGVGETSPLLPDPSQRRQPYSSGVSKTSSGELRGPLLFYDSNGQELAVEDRHIVMKSSENTTSYTWKVTGWDDEWTITMPGVMCHASGIEHVPFEFCDVVDYVEEMCSKWKQIGFKLKLKTEVAAMRSREEENSGKCILLLEEAVGQGKLTSWIKLLEILRSNGVKLHALAERIEREITEKYCKEIQAKTGKSEDKTEILCEN